MLPGGRFADLATNRLPQGATLDLEGPFGGLYLRDDSTKPALMLAGGTGITPMLAMLEELFTNQPDRAAHLYWGVRTQADLYLDQRFRDWLRNHPQFRYTPVLSQPDAGWHGARGLVHAAALAELGEFADREAYLSGPPPMVRAAKDALLDRGLAVDRIFHDSFDAAG